MAESFQAREKSTDPLSANLTAFIKTEISTAEGASTPWEKAKNCFSGCAGFIARVFTSDAKLSEQFMQLLDECVPKSAKPTTQTPSQGVAAESAPASATDADNPSTADGAQVADPPKSEVPSGAPISRPEQARPRRVLRRNIVARASSAAELQVRAEAQKIPINGFAGQAFEILMIDEKVQSAVRNLYESLSGSGSLVDGMEEKEFCKKFLQNVAHATVKACARSIEIPDGRKVQVNFSKFLQPSPRVKHLVFKNILKPGSLEKDKDVGETSDSLLGTAFNAIGRATTHNPTPDSIRQEIRNTKIDKPLTVKNRTHTCGEMWDTFMAGNNVLCLSPSGKAVSKEVAFELLRGKVADTLPNTLDAISGWSASDVPDELGAGDDGDGGAARFTRTLQGTPVEGMFSLPENTTKEKADDALSTISYIYAALQNEAKEIAKLHGTGKIRIALAKNQTFTEADVNRLRELREQENAT